MKCRRLLSCSVLGFLLTALNCAVAQSAATQSSVPFLNGIEVRINDREPILFGIDTGGAADFFIVQEKARELDLPVVGRRLARGSDRQSGAQGSEVEVLKANTLAVAGHTFTAPQGLVVPGSRFSGTIGITLFRDVLLTLDYPQDRLTITSGQLKRDDADVIAYTTQPDASFRPLRFSPTVMITLAGRSIPALVDTGARKVNADLIVPKEIAATLPLGATESETVIQDVTGRSFPSYTAKLLGDLRVGNVVVHEPTILVSDWLGFVDLARVCNRFIITIDQRNRLLRLTSETSPGVK